MEVFGAPREESTLARARLDLGRAAASLGWVVFGALAGGVATRSLWRGRHGPSNGQEPDVVLDVPELEVDRITLEVRDLRPHVAILVELANLLNLTVGVAARLDQVKLEIEDVLERSEREVEGAAQTALGKGQGPDTPASP